MTEMGEWKQSRRAGRFVAGRFGAMDPAQQIRAGDARLIPELVTVATLDADSKHERIRKEGV